MKQSPKKMTQKINKSKGCYFEKINKIDKPLTRHIKKKKKGLRKIRNDREITTDTKEIQSIIIKNITNNYVPTNWTTWMKWINS